MEAEEAARAIFPSFSRPLSKFLRVTRQQPRHSAEQTTRHLTECLSFDLSPRAFLERFFSQQETFEVSFGLEQQFVSVTLSGPCYAQEFNRSIGKALLR